MLIDKNFAMCDNINNIRLRLLDCGYAQSGGDWVGNIVLPPYARLYYIVSGDPYILENGKKIALQPGYCYLMPTGYSFRHACGHSMEQLYFHLNLTDYNGADLLRSCHGLMEYRPPKGMIERMQQLVRRQDLFGGLQLRQELYSTLLTLVDKYDIRLETIRYSRCVQLAIEYIQSHLSLQLGIPVLAANSFVSESTLAKKFKAEVGMTIGSYIDEAILFEAEQLLLKSELSVLQISERFGFCDQFYFSRRFKMKYGETPQKYRKLKLI